MTRNTEATVSVLSAAARRRRERWGAGGCGTRSLEWWAVGSKQCQAVDLFIGERSAAQRAPCTLRNKPNRY